MNQFLKKKEDSCKITVADLDNYNYLKHCNLDNYLDNYLDNNAKNQQIEKPIILNRELVVQPLSGTGSILHIMPNYQYAQQNNVLPLILIHIPNFP